MSIDITNQNTGNATGIDLVVFRDPDTPHDTSAIIERAANSGSAPSGSWSVVATLTPTDTAGTYWIDSLPLTNTVYWYRVKHVHDAYEDSNYSAPISASATVLSDIDRSKRPWALGKGQLQLVMVVSASDSSYWHVTSSVNQPLTGPSSIAPSISVYSSQNVGTIVTGSTSGSFRVSRPASGSNSSVTFASALAGYFDGRDLLELDALNTFNINDNIFITAVVVNEQATASFVAVSASNASNYPLNVSVFQAVSSSVTNVSPWNGTGSLWLATRPTGSTAGNVRFRATSSVAVDYDDVTISRQDLSGSASFLKLLVNVTGSNATQLHVSCSAINPFAAPIGFGVYGSPTAGITATRTGFSTFNVTRPTSGSEGVVEFIVSSSQVGIQEDRDTLQVSVNPDGDTAALQVRLDVLSLTSSSMQVSASVYDPKGLNPSSSFTTAIQPSARFNTSYVGSGVWNIDRPPAGTNDGLFIVTVNSAGRIGDSDSVSVPEQISGLTNLNVKIDLLSVSASYVHLSASCADPLNQFPVTLTEYVQPTNAITYSGSTTTGVFVVNRPPRGSGGATFNVRATAFGRQSDTEVFNLPEMDSTRRPSSFAVISEGVSGGDYAVYFRQLGWASAAQTQSAGLLQANTTQSSSLSVPSFSPYVVITPLVNNGVPVYYRPNTQSGSIPPSSEYIVSFTPDPELSYGVKLVANADTYNDAVEQYTNGISGNASGSTSITPFKVTEIKILADTLYNYVTVTIADPDNTINRLMANPIQAYTRVGPAARTGPVNPTSAPASGTINGNYQFQTALASVPTHIDLVVQMADSTTVGLGPFALDTAFYPVIDARVSYATSSIATLYGVVDEYTPTGSNFFYRILGSGAPWGTGSIDAAHRFSVNVSQSVTQKDRYQMNAKNVNGAMNPVDFLIDVDQWSNRYTYDTAVSESLSSGSYVVNLRDSAGVVTGSTKVKFLFASGGVPALMNASSSPGGTTTTGQYVFNFPLHPDNATIVQPLVYLVGGTSESLEAVSFDSDKRPNVWNLQTYASGNRGFIVAQVDSDAGIGANRLGYFVTGSSEQFLTVPANRIVSWSVGATTLGQDIQVRAYDQSGANPGPTTSGLIPPMLVQSSTGSSFTPVTLNVFPVDTATQTSVTFTSNGTVQYYVSGVLQNSGNPPSSPHIYARPTDGNPRNVTYVATHATSGDVRSVNFLVMPQVQATGSDNYPLTMQARIIPKGQFSSSVQFYVADPVGQSGQDVTVVWSASNMYGSGTPASPITLSSGLVTTVIDTTSAIAQIDVPLNPIGSGSFTVQAYAYRANRQPAAASIVVGEQRRGLYNYTVRTQYLVPQASSLEIVFSVQKFVSGSGYEVVTPSSTVDTVSLQYVKDLTGVNLIANASMSYNPSTTFWSAFYTGPITDKRPYTFGVRVANTDPSWPALERSGIAAHLDQTITYIS